MNKIKELLELAKELGIENQVKAVVENNFPSKFNMNEYDMEVYYDKNATPVGILLKSGIVVSLHDSPGCLNSNEGLLFCENTLLNDSKCSLFPEDIEIADIFEYLNMALVSIGGEPLKKDVYLASRLKRYGGTISWIINLSNGNKEWYTCSEKANCRPVMVIK